MNARPEKISNKNPGRKNSGKKDKSISNKAVKKNAPARAAVKKLRLQNARLAKMLKASPVAFLVINPQSGKIVEANRTCENVLGYSHRQLVDGVFSAYEIFADDGAYAALVIEAKTSAQIINWQTKLRTAGGGVIAIDLCAGLLPFGNDEYLVINFSGAFSDKSLERLTENYQGKIQNLERALDASNLVSVTDAQGMIIYANARFCEVSQFSRDELLGNDHRIVNSGHHPKEFMKSLWRTISQGEIWRGDICNRAKDGSLYWVSSTIVPFKNKHGKPYQYFAIRQDITERKKFALELEHSREALLHAQQLAGVGSWEWFPENDVPVWSPEMFAIYGLDASEPPVPFAEVSKLFAPQSWAALGPTVENAFNTGQPYELECEIVRRNGTRGWIISRGSPIKNEEGAIVGLRGTIQDISERKRNEERNRLIINALPDLIFILSRSGVFVDFHASEVKRLAYKPEFFLEKHFTEIFDHELAAKMQQAIARISAGSPLERLEYSLPMGNTPGYYEASFTPLDGDRVMVVVRETTERKKAEEMLRDQATLLDKASDAILVRDLEHRIVFWNHAASNIYGWSRDETIGRSIRDLLYSDPGDFDRATHEVLTDGEFRGELQQQTKDGQKITVAARWTLLRDEAGKPKSVLAINTDITERKKLEQQFLRAQRLESIGTLAGGIAHDLNNVLTPIMLAVAVLRTGSITADQLELLSMIEASVKHGTSMVRQVLSFARGAEGNPRPMQIRDLVKELEPIIRDTFPKNIHLKIQAAENLWLLKGDFTQLHQVLMNLAVNARDAMPNGGELFLSIDNATLDAQYAGMQLDAHPGDYVVVRLEDTGQGMPADVLERIFEPFFTTKPHGKGTGLGLSTSLAIIKGHGGFIRAYSEPGRGTRFHLYLPALPAGQEEQKSGTTDEMPRGSGQLILVIDDEPSVRNVTKQTLEAFGYRVKTAADGAEGVAVFAELRSQIAVVLTDIMMPVLDGHAAIRVMRKMQPSLPVIAASGLEVHAKSIMAESGAFSRFLPKPYTAQMLLTTIRDALRANKMNSKEED